VIPIPKHSTKPPAYRSIALSSTFCKLTEFILKKTDWTGILSITLLFPTIYLAFGAILILWNVFLVLPVRYIKSFAIYHFFQLRSLTFNFLMTLYIFQPLFIDFMILKSLFIFAHTYPPYFMNVIYHSPLLKKVNVFALRIEDFHKEVVLATFFLIYIYDTYKLSAAIL